MTLPPQHSRPSHSVMRALLVLYGLFVIYGSLVPWVYVDRSLADALEAFSRIPFLQLGIGSRADWVANLLLFIPLTFLARALFAPDGARGRRRVVSFLIAIAATLLAVSLEFTQLFFPQRTVSQNDILAESLGALAGLVLHGFWGERFQRWLDDFWRLQQQKDRLDRLLHAYLVLLFIFNVLPLDLTLSPVELFHKWTQGRVVLLPFAGLKGDWFNGLYETATDTLIWLPAGVLWALRGHSTGGRVVRQALGAALVIELLQLFVYSRVTDVTDVCLAGAGGWLGWWGVHRTANALPRLLGQLAHRWWVLWLGWALLTLGIFWFPFNFSLDGVSLSAASSALTRLPFTTYYFTSEYHAINELLRKIGFFLPGGLLLGLALYKTDGLKRRATLAPVLLLGLLAATVEAGQLALPDKVADVTDALLESAGGILGYLIALWVGSAGHSPVSPAVAHGAKPTRGERPRAPATRPPRAGWPAYSGHGAAVGVLGVLMLVARDLPGLPYNVRELFAPGLGGVASALVLSLVAYGMANAGFWLLGARRRHGFLLFPAALVVHGALTWVLLRLAVPLESLHDIVGTPVLDWPWEWETWGRYTALHLVVMAQLLGATLLVRAIWVPAAATDVLYWALVCALMAWPLHLVVVRGAATDNLTELMAGDASFWASSVLAGALFLSFLCASALSAAGSSPQRRGGLLGVALLAAAGAALLFWTGTEQVIVKYGRVFSAFQFLLSPDREHYLQGDALWLRYGAAFLGVSLALAASQWVSWRRCAGDIAAAGVKKPRGQGARGG